MTTDKRGGICFRVDDNKPIRQWVEFARVFDRHGFKFCAALCPGRMAGDEDYVRLVRSLQDRGHEIMDHTPLHSRGQSSPSLKAPMSMPGARCRASTMWMQREST